MSMIKPQIPVRTKSAVSVKPQLLQVVNTGVNTEIRALAFEVRKQEVRS